jgi:hypothetical protein
MVPGTATLRGFACRLVKSCISRIVAAVESEIRRRGICGKRKMRFREFRLWLVYRAPFSLRFILRAGEPNGRHAVVTVP